MAPGTPQCLPHKMAIILKSDSDLGLCGGAGDENRTRTSSLGSRAIMPDSGPDLATCWSGVTVAAPSSP
jgi:hypothetical protein